MALNRSPYQGVLNIVRFNWHFYLLAGGTLSILLLLRDWLPAPLPDLALAGIVLAVGSILVSLGVSHYVYDRSALYRLSSLAEADGRHLFNIHAGFDETSAILRDRFPDATVTIGDFYDPALHTEVSIRRARRAYPPSPGTVPVTTTALPFPTDTFDASLAILSAHEIRVEAERIQFFRELRRVTKPTGKIYVTEHLRDGPNFLAYTIGFLHFYSRPTWLTTFRQAGLKVEQEIKTTPFITTFVLA